MDLNSARIVVALNLMNASFGQTLQLTGAALVDASPSDGTCSRLDDVAWDLIGIQATELEAKDLDAAGGTVRLDHATIGEGLDLRHASDRSGGARWRVSGARLGPHVAISPTEPTFVAPDAVTMSAPYAIEVGYSCVPGDDGPALGGAVAGDARDLEEAGIGDRALLRDASHSSASRRYYTRRITAAALSEPYWYVADVLLAGYGRWDASSYVLLFFALLGLASFVFRDVFPGSDAWGRGAQVVMFSLAVLLPSVIDIGLEAKGSGKRAYPWTPSGSRTVWDDPKTAELTIWHHALHVAGWLYCVIAAAAIAARLSP